MEYNEYVELSCNGIKLVYRFYYNCGKDDDRNGLYIVDEETLEDLDGPIIHGEGELIKDRYIVITYSQGVDDYVTIYDCLEKKTIANIGPTNGEVELINGRYIVISYTQGVDKYVTIYDYLEKKPIANDCKLKKIYYKSGWPMRDIYTIALPDGKEHLFSYELLGAEKDVINICADSIKVFFFSGYYAKFDMDYYLALCDEDGFKLYSNKHGLVENLELQDYSLEQANIIDMHNNHILKNNKTGKKVFVEVSCERGKADLHLKIDSTEYDEIDIFEPAGVSVCRNDRVSAFQKDNKIAVYEFWIGLVSSFAGLKDDADKLFEIQGTDIEFLKEISYDSCDPFCNRITYHNIDRYFSYTDIDGNKGILRFAWADSGWRKISCVTKDIPIESISQELANTYEWDSARSIPFYNGDKQGFCSYLYDMSIEAKYQNIIPLSQKDYICWIDEEHFDYIRLGSNKQIYLEQNCEMVYIIDNSKSCPDGGTTGQIIVFKNPQNKHTILYCYRSKQMFGVERVDDLAAVTEHNVHNRPYFLVKSDDEKVGLVYSEAKGYPYINYFRPTYDDLKICCINDTVIAVFRTKDQKYHFEIVQDWYWPRDDINSCEWREWCEFINYKEESFDQIYVANDFIFLQDKSKSISKVYSLKSGDLLWNFSCDVVISENEDGSIILKECNEDYFEEYMYDGDSDCLVLLGEDGRRTPKIRWTRNRRRNMQNKIS